MVVSALVGTAPANARDEAIAKGIIVQNHIPTSPKLPYWKMLAVVNPLTPGLSRESNASGLIIASAIGIAIVVIITGLRIFSRAYSKTSRLGWDDFFVVWAALAGITWLALQMAMCTVGSLGKHAWNGTYEEYFWMQALGHENQNVFIIWSTLSKLAIACFNWRLTGRSSRKWKMVHITCIAFIAAYGIIFLLLGVLQCRPVPAAFNLITASQTTNYKCHIKVIAYGAALLSMHTISDFILLGIPIVVVWRLHLARKTKLRAIIPLSVGAFGCVATILRFYYQWNANKLDILYDFLDQGVWSAVDTVIATCVTSLPACYALLHRGYNRVTGITNSSKNTNSPSHPHSDSYGSSRKRSKPSKNMSDPTDTTITEYDVAKSNASSHTLGNDESYGENFKFSQEVEKSLSDPELGLQPAVASPSALPEQRMGVTTEIFSGDGAGAGHPNIRDDYEKRISAGK